MSVFSFNWYLVLFLTRKPVVSISNYFDSKEQIKLLIKLVTNKQRKITSKYKIR